MPRTGWSFTWSLLQPGLRGPNFQERARAFRYDTARALAAEHGYTRIATAHNRDDQAETVLYRLVKYPSPAALAGIAPLDGDLIRPVLCLGADEIRAYCDEAGIRYGDDVTNEQPVYARNRLRLRVLPELKAVNPRFTEGLAEAAAAARQERELLDRLVDAAWSRAVVTAPDTAAAERVGRPFAGGRPRSAAGARRGRPVRRSRRPCAPPACGAWRAWRWASGRS